MDLPRNILQQGPGDDASSDNEHPVQALTAYSAPSPRGDAKDTGFSKASPGYAGAKMTSCNTASTRPSPLQAVASPRDRPTNLAHYYQLSRGFHHLQAEQG